MLQLPDFDGLSEEQEDVLDLPLDSSAIVTGPPGTGKTIMAIYRARILHGSGRPTLLLMYGRLLASYTAAAARKFEVDGVVSTYHSWFTRFWRACYGADPPKASAWTFDWAACKERLLQQPPPRGERLHVVVDEGQDMPKDLYFVLRLLSDSITVFADENQRITADQSTIREITAATGIREIRTLTRNYRNTRPIAEFAATFYTGLQSGIAGLPPLTARGEKPALTTDDILHRTVGVLANYERAHADQSIGILVPFAHQVQSFRNRLQARTRNPVQAYVSVAVGRKLRPIDFAAPGVKIITWASAKGLDFDTVFLPELQSFTGDPAGDDVRMKLYVLTSRARKILSLGYTGDGVPALVAALPMHLMDDRRP
jgi:superfamily I DNA/RNA helicase